MVFSRFQGALASPQLQPPAMLPPAPLDAQGMLPSWDLTLRHYTHQAIKKLRCQQLIYNIFWLGTTCGTMKVGGKGESKKKCPAKAVVDFTFCFKRIFLSCHANQINT